MGSVSLLKVTADSTLVYAIPGLEVWMVPTGNGKELARVRVFTE